MSTDPAEFKRFHELLLSSAPTGYVPYYFRLAKGGKEPDTRGGWKDERNRLTFDQALKQLGLGYNVAIAGTDKDKLVIVDIDRPGIEDVKPTLRVKSRKRQGWHNFYFTSDVRCKRNIPTESFGEVRSSWQYVVTCGSYVILEQEKVDKLPKPEKTLAGHYTIENAVAPADIVFEELPSVFRQQILDAEIKPDKELTKNQNKFKSGIWDLTIKDVLKIDEPPHIRFASPLHGSETGKNTSISSQGLLHCWRHNVSLTPIQCLAVKAGILDCMAAGEGHAGSGAGPSKLNLKDKQIVRKIWSFAKENSLLPPDDADPYEVEKKALPTGVEEFPLSDSEYVTWTPQEIRICRKTVAGQGDSRITIKNPPKPLRRLLVDGDTYFEYEFNGKNLTTKVDDLLHQLSADGCVLFRQRAMDALSAVTMGMARETVRVQATYGVYDEDGKLRICENPHPVKPDQMRIWEQIADATKHEPTAEELYAYLEVLKHWHPYECIPFMGAGIANPFTPIIRGRRMLFPHLDAWSPEHDLGKSLVTIIASTQLWSIEPTSGPAVDSKFRFAYHIDSCCLPLAVEEADRLKPGLQSVLKESAERWVADERGTTDLDKIQYCARSILMLSGNNIAFSSSAAQLKRCLIVRFDSTAKRFRKKGNKQLEEAVDNLAPVGYGLTRWWVQDHPSTDELVQSLREWKEDIRKARSAWGSPKRPEAWSCVYLGLKILEHGCKKLGLDWRAPSVGLFVEKVVVPVEESTWAVERSNASRVASWLFKYTSEFKRTEKTYNKVEGEVTKVVCRGEDETWRDAGELVRADGITVPGRFIIDSLLDAYNDQADDAFQVPSVIELTKQGADEAGIPYDQVLDSDMVRARKVDIKGRKLRAAFVPDSLIGGDTGAQLTVETGGELPGADGKGAHEAEWFSIVPIGSQEFPALGTNLSNSLDTSSLDISSQVPKEKEHARIEGTFYKEALTRLRGNPMRPPSGVVYDIMCAHGLKPNDAAAVERDVDAAFDDWMHSSEGDHALQNGS